MSSTAEWFLYTCTKCGMTDVKGREGGQLACRQEPCSASGDEVSYVPLVASGQPVTMTSVLHSAKAA